MSHYAKVKNGIVEKVLVMDDDVAKTYSEASPAIYVKTSYNTTGGVHYDPVTGQPSADQSKALRKNYAGIGYTYDAQRDAFIPPQPYPSWTLDEEKCTWTSSIAMPTDDKFYDWDENSGSWVEAIV
jgi:hypothetical protein